MAMTVSLNKGKKYESNFAHNERKSRLENKSQQVVESFYATENHQHIQGFYTRLNVDMPHKEFGEIYDKLFGEAIEEYNQKQKRKDRKIGKGKAISGELKKNNVLAIETMLTYLSSDGDQRKKLVQNLGGQQLFEETFLEKFKGKTEKDLKKDLAFWKAQETYGEAYYRQIKKDKKSKTHTEFVAQLGNAEDFNEVKNGKIVKSFDREDPNGKWQKAKRALKMYMDGFQERNPNLILVGYSIHMDENTPHVHFDIVPVAEQSKTKGRGKTRKNGLSRKVSFDGALESQGFEGSPKQFFTKWQHQEADILADLMEKEMGEKRKAGKTNNIENVHEYKKLKALEAAKLEELAKIDEQQKQKQSAVKDLEDQSQDLNQQISEGMETVKKVQEWTEKKTQELNNRENNIDSRESDIVERENKVAARESKIADRENKVAAREETLKTSENSLESREKAFNKKLEKESDLDKRIDDKQNILDDYKTNWKKKLEEKKQAAIEEKKQEFKKEVEDNKKKYLDEFNRQQRESLKQRERDLEEREKNFIAKIRQFVNGVRVVYINAGLQSICKTKREALAKAKEYVKMDKDQQKALEKKAFSGAGGRYRKLSAFKEAVDYLFHGGFVGDEVASDGAKISPLQPLKELADEAEADAKSYEDMKNGRAGLRRNSPSKSVDREL